MARYLGVDYGGKRVGVALSDEAGSIAFPQGEFPNDASLCKRLLELMKERGVAHIVVGDTRAPGGGANPVTKEAEEFMKKLEEESGLPVFSVFEAWSSIEASRYAPEGKGHDNAAAAAVILQRYLDMHPRTVG